MYTSQYRREKKFEIWLKRQIGFLKHLNITDRLRMVVVVIHSCSQTVKTIEFNTKHEYINIHFLPYNEIATPL